MQEFDAGECDISRSQSQLERCLAEPLIAMKEFSDLDVLIYSKRNDTTYPMIARMYRDILEYFDHYSCL